MFEFVSEMAISGAGKIVFPAVIGAGTAIITMIVKDIVLHELRERKKERNALIDRKLSSLYNPLYIFCVSGQRTLATAVADEKCFGMIIENQHLFSKKLQSLFDEYLGLTRGDFSQTTMTASDGRKGLDLSESFAIQLKIEMDELRKEFQ